MSRFVPFLVFVLVVKAVVVFVVKPDFVFGSDPQTEADQSAIQGHWAVVYSEANGAPAPRGAFDRAYFLFEGDQVEVLGREARFTLDASGDVGRIDTYYNDIRERGIYRLDGDELVVCFHTRGGLPDDFKTQPYSNCILFVLARY